jgi:hypothetical protein
MPGSGKKSQLTIFFISGIIILISVMLILTLNQNKEEKNIFSMSGDIGEKDSVKDIARKIVNSCLSQISKYNLKLAASQGGAIYKSQGGTIDDHLINDDGILFVLYGGSAVGLGKHIPPLHKSDGKDSIEEQLENAINGNLKNCLDFSLLTQQRIEVSVSEGNTIVRVNKDDVTVYLDHKVELKLGSDSHEQTIEGFSYTLPVGLKGIYEHSKSIAEESLNSLEGRYVLEKIDLGLGKEIVIVSDTKSFIDGEQYKFMFGTISEGADETLTGITGAAITDINNSRPSANAGLNRTVELLKPSVLFGAGTDLDGDILTFKWQFIDKPGGSTSTLFDPESPNPTFTPDVAGKYIFRLRTNDGKSFSDLSTVSILAELSEANKRPTIPLLGTKTVNVGEVIFLPGVGFDEDNDPLSFMWRVVSKPSISKSLILIPSQQSPEYVPDIAGSYTFTLLSNDGKQDSNPRNFTLIASQAGSNRRPSSDPGYDRNVKVGEKVKLLGNGFDPDKDPLSFLWTLSSKPGGSVTSLSSSTVSTPDFTPDVVGNYIFGLVVDDGKIESELVAVKYASSAVSGNTRPNSIAGISRNVNILEESYVVGIGEDADKDKLAFRWALGSKPAGSTSSLTTPNSDNTRIIPDIPGQYLIFLIANDGKQDSATGQITLTASDIGKNREPKSDPGFERYVKVGDKITLMGNGYDPDKEPLIFEWKLISKPTGSQAAISKKDIAAPSITPEVQGIYELELKVSDKLSSNTKRVVINAKQISSNFKPIANAGNGYNALLGEKINLFGEGKDADFDDLKFRWSIEKKPSESYTRLNNPDLKNPGIFPDKPGIYELILIINDGKEDSDVSKISINIVEPGKKCIHGSCDISGKMWCDNGAFNSEGYCSICSGLDPSCPVCKSGTCDRENQRHCSEGKWSEISYCDQCGNVDSSCKIEKCNEGTCDSMNKKYCKNNLWNSAEYCTQCGGKDSSCSIQCINNACDAKNKKWCSNGEWTDLGYCSNCGNRDSSCGSICSNNICDTSANKWCNNNAWDSLGYCSKCDDSDCLKTCSAGSCDIQSRQWCNNGTWANSDYCLKCGSKDASCAVKCTEESCDTSTNSFCLDKKWEKTNYCSTCSLFDSDCTVSCAEGQCDLLGKRTCINSEWTNNTYCEFCGIQDSSCPGYCTPKADGICDVDCALGTDPDCEKQINATNQTIINQTTLSLPTCNDFLKNGNETDVDCGGTCIACQIGMKCRSDSDCNKGICSSGLCSIKSANATVKNKTSDIDEEDDGDSDKDGIPDEWELRNGMDPKDPSDAGLDFDDDGLINIQEFTYGTNPFNKDSDNDGISDKEELDSGTDPLDPISKPGGIGWLLFWTVIVIVIFGAASYAAYYYRSIFTGKSSISQIAPNPSNPLNVFRGAFPKKKPIDRIVTRELVKIRRDKKEQAREKIIEKFEDNDETKKPINKKRNQIKTNVDAFSELKMLSKK